MSIPDYQALMLPFLKILQGGEEQTIADLIEDLAKKFGLSERDREELLPSGRQRKFDNRVGWARTYLAKAVLIEATGRAKVRITKRGKETLESGVERINVRYLMQFKEFADFQRRSTIVERTNEEDIADGNNHQTPEELLESSYQILRANLAQELLIRLKKNSPRFFENLVVELLVAMGYGGSRKDAGTAIGQSGDGGIDGIIKEDKLGLDIVYIQAKRWEANVGRPVVQAFAGSLEGQRAKKGILITTSKFSNDAKEYVGIIEKKIVLIDGEQLAQLMIDYNVGVNEAVRYVVKRIDLDYFEED